MKISVDRLMGHPVVYNQHFDNIRKIDRLFTSFYYISIKIRNSTIPCKYHK